MFLIFELMAQPALGHAIAIGLFAGMVALGGQALGTLVQRYWRHVGGGVVAVSGDYRLAVAALVATGLGSALGWGYLWSLPLLTLAGAVLYLLGGLLVCRSTRWHLDEAFTAGLLAGFVTPLLTLAWRFFDVGLV